MTLILASSRPGSALTMDDTLLTFHPRIESTAKLPSQFLPGSTIEESSIADLQQKIVFPHESLAIGWAADSITRAIEAIRIIVERMTFPFTREALPSAHFSVTFRPASLAPEALAASGSPQRHPFHCTPGRRPTVRVSGRQVLALNH